MSRLSLTVAREGHDITACPDHRILDDNLSQELGERLFPLAAEMRGGTFTLDLSRVEGVSSTALAKTVRLFQKVRAAGGRLVLDNANEMVYQSFSVTGLTTLFEVRAAEPVGSV